MSPHDMDRDVRFAFAVARALIYLVIRARNLGYPLPLPVWRLTLIINKIGFMIFFLSIQVTPMSVFLVDKKPGDVYDPDEPSDEIFPFHVVSTQIVHSHGPNDMPQVEYYGKEYDFLEFWEMNAPSGSHVFSIATILWLMLARWSGIDRTRPLYVIRY